MLTNTDCMSIRRIKNVVARSVIKYYDQAEEKIFSYIEKGIDIPHHIIITDKENINHAIVYRFFTDLNKAQKALDYIIKNYKNAQIIPVDRSGKMVTLSDK